MRTKSVLLGPAIVAVGIATYVTVAGLTGFCPTCQGITDRVFGGSASSASQASLVTPASAETKQPSGHSSQPGSDESFTLTHRPGAVDLEQEYDLSNLTIPLDEIHTLLPRDAIPALTDPKMIPAGEADYLNANSRVIAVEIDDQAIGLPLAILNYHEIINTTLAGVPIAVTYCPLCDSATVFKRTVGDDAAVLEFGVSGALYNSNVLMYDRTDKGLWSQLALQAVSGPRVGTELEYLPIQMMSFERFTSRYPDAKVLSTDTGYDIPYTSSPYDWYFQDGHKLLVSVKGIGDTLPRKTLGLGILAGEDAIFIPVDVIGQERTIDTPMGPVKVRTSEAGVEVLSAPEGVRTAQAFYYSWSAFHPRTEVITE
ncbi:MAG TPA: DUF3179 domain-containing protein [Phycisphaerales bacterium]|nr:DUF3179 domain-containing protein [Phycisphaerales bacterium]